MNVSFHRPAQRATILALVAAAALVLVPVGLSDDWARDRAAVATVEGLDPAIRTAVAARSAPLPSVASPTSASTTVVSSDGFAWADAGVGAVAGIAFICLILFCVNLLRHDGRLRSA
jgi:hypothetical protein